MDFQKNELAKIKLKNMAFINISDRIATPFYQAIKEQAKCICESRSPIINSYLESHMDNNGTKFNCMGRIWNKDLDTYKHKQVVEYRWFR